MKPARSLSATIAPLAIIALLPFSGCTPSTKRADAPVPHSESGAEPETLPGGIEEVAPVDGQAPAEEAVSAIPEEAVPVTLVLGPGMARGFAHAGVLLALAERGIPVGMIVGVEVGGLIASLYAVSKTTNEFDWSLQKIKADFFFDDKINLAKLFGEAKSSERLFGRLKQMFGKQTFSGTKAPIRLGIYSELENRFEFIGKGRLAGALRVVLSDRTLFPQADWYGAPSWSAGAHTPYPVQEARKIRRAPVIAVDVLPSSGPDSSEDAEAKQRYSKSMSRVAAASRSDLRSADIVLRPDLNGVGLFDFEKRGKSVFAGKAAVEARLSEIQEALRASAAEKGEE
ncbi:MAG: patatin-like phospholipase family protein [Bdellovibrionales bacterium]|nr:patatin-like phospholipase family protein [Bdellovibrionales bacterium]